MTLAEVKAELARILEEKSQLEDEAAQLSGDFVLVSIRYKELIARVAQLREMLQQKKEEEA